MKFIVLFCLILVLGLVSTGAQGGNVPDQIQQPTPAQNQTPWSIQEVQGSKIIISGPKTIEIETHNKQIIYTKLVSLDADAPYLLAISADPKVSTLTAHNTWSLYIHKLTAGNFKEGSAQAVFSPPEFDRSLRVFYGKCLKVKSPTIAFYSDGTSAELGPADLYFYLAPNGELIEGRKLNHSLHLKHILENLKAKRCHELTAEEIAQNNHVVKFLHRGHLQFETNDQCQEIKKAFTDLKTLSSDNLKKKRYADYELTPNKWSVLELLNRYISPSPLSTLDEETFYDDVMSPLVKVEVDKFLEQLARCKE